MSKACSGNDGRLVYPGLNQIERGPSPATAVILAQTKKPRIFSGVQRPSQDSRRLVSWQKFPDQQVRVDYEGKVPGDEIKFTRTVAESIKEELVGRQVKESNASNP